MILINISRNYEIGPVIHIIQRVFLVPSHASAYTHLNYFENLDRLEKWDLCDYSLSYSMATLCSLCHFL